MGGPTDGWTNRRTEVVYMLFMIPRDRGDASSTPPSFVLISIGPNAVTALYLALEEGSVLHGMIF